MTEERLKQLQDYHEEYRRTHREQANRRAREWYITNKNDPLVQSKLKESSLKYRAKKRKRLLDMFGNKCATCGLDDSRVLQVDHIFANGSHERKKLGGVGNFVTKLIRGELRKEDYQLLCANCNWIKRLETDYKKLEK